jgi:hypothetical protein
MAEFHPENSSDYQKYERGQKHGIGQQRRDRLFSRRSRHTSPNSHFAMITAAIVLVALVVLTGWDTAGHQE